MLIISSGEFRQNQKAYFDKVDEGQHVIVQRGKDKAYVLTPVKENDLYLNEEMIQKLNTSLKQAEEGNSLKVSNAEEISQLLDLWTTF